MDAETLPSFDALCTGANNARADSWWGFAWKLWLLELLGRLKDLSKKYSGELQWSCRLKVQARAGSIADDNKHSKWSSPVGRRRFDTAIITLNNQGTRAMRVAHASASEFLACLAALVMRRLFREDAPVFFSAGPRLAFSIGKAPAVGDDFKRPPEWI